MLIHAAHFEQVHAIPGAAHIVISVEPRFDTVTLTAFCQGGLDSTYAPMAVSRLPSEIAKLLAELNAQLQAAAPASQLAEL